MGVKYDQYQPAALKYIGTDDVVRHLLDETLGGLKVSIVGGNVTLEAGDLQIGAVEIKDHDGANRLDIVSAGEAIAAPTSYVISGHDGANTRLLKTDVAGELQIDVLTLPNVTIGAALPAGNNNIGDVDVVTLPSLPAGANNIGDVDVATEPASAADGAVSLPAVLKVIAGWSGTAVKALKTDAAGELQVDVLTLPNVTIGAALPAGTNNIGDVDVLTLPSLPAGNNNIGDVDVATLPALPAGTNNIGDVDVLTLPAIPAGTNRIGGAYAVSGQIIDENGAVLTVKRAFANIVASTTDGNIISAVTSKKLRILAVVMQCGATATNITLNSKPAGAGAAISPQFQNGANGGEVLPFNAYGWFETVVSEGLTATTGAGSTTGVHVLYVEV